VLIDRELRHRYVNKAYCKYSDKPAEAVLGAPSPRSSAPMRQRHGCR